MDLMEMLDRGITHTGKQLDRIKKTNLQWYHWLGIAIVLLYLVARLSPETPTDLTTSNGSMAYVMCEDRVKEYLKAPSTAEFSGVMETQIVAQGNRKYAVIGWVDAENSFGTKLRTKYICKVTDEGNGQWQFEPLMTNDGG